MKTNAVLTILVVLVMAAHGQSPAQAQMPPSMPVPVQQTAPQITPQELDAMLAPIALYPDPLVAQILMAATYPLEVVEADRWRQEPANASIEGEQLTSVLDQQAWDPSVKSLVPFPQILHMMDSNLEWTERLGNAFLDDEAAVMDSVQRLRQRAEAAGKLVSTPQQVVSTNDGVVVIEPANPDIVYIPVYDPMVVYGAWPYPAFPPFYFPEFFGGVIVGGFGFGWIGFATIGPLWGWNHWDWRRHHINLDRDRFGALNGHRPPPGGVWQHDPSHRLGVPYRSLGGRSRFGENGVPSGDASRMLRGYPPRVPAPFHPANAAGQPPAPARRFPPTFESFGPGSDARAAASRGHDSRMSMPGYGAPHMWAPRGAIPSGHGSRR
ncbi:DUF3300 domain-containing protein [Paraburkholderia lycopersici]|uniref:DUF3300 domain-containing protein n=1 Tax=Paraburkholderia lycopersici TaxID=416944 RepID=A0A1G7CXH5_9BURK|nr:DUF3300 domain-containing protein [Paraburkholderia lycopersici]SDE44154.1 Protein of unknown function [Paraburkholderia lycopersici]